MSKITTILFLMFSIQAHAFDGQTYHLDKEPFIHPLIIEDLTALVSDEGDQIVSINITESIGSNRYFGKIEISPTEKKNMHMYHNSGNPYVSFDSENACGSNGTARSPLFGYDLVGKINNIYVLHTSESTCGTGVWHSLLFVEIIMDKGISKSENVLSLTRDRQIVKKLGEIPLGDRYEGYIEIRGKSVFISKDARTSSIFKKDTTITLNTNI